MPTGESPHKEEQHLAPLPDRIRMIELAIKDNPHFVLSRYEADAGEKNYTYRTAERLSRDFPDDAFYFIFGADSLAMFPHWVHPEIIAKHLHLVAAMRGTDGAKACEQMAESCRKAFAADIRLLTVPIFSISSTDIRNRVSQEKSIRYLVPEPVREYISSVGLYRQGM